MGVATFGNTPFMTAPLTNRKRELKGVLPNSPPDIGGVDATSIRCREATFDGADGVVMHDETFRCSDHPVCGPKVGCAAFLLMPQPPLLYQEGSCWTPKFQLRHYTSHI